MIQCVEQNFNENYDVNFENKEKPLKKVTQQINLCFFSGDIYHVYRFIKSKIVEKIVYRIKLEK